MVSMMDPDEFGFDSITWMITAHREIPLCKAGHLITARGAIEGDAHSLFGLPQKLLLFPANMRPELLDQEE